jgi:hypothetical protein
MKVNQAIVIEREDIVSWRRKCFARIKKFKEENKNIVYTDESRLSKGHTVQNE